MNRYGTSDTLSYCWKWKFMHQAPHTLVCACNESYKNCSIEDRQLRIVFYCLQFGCTLSEKNDASLRVASKFNHTQLIEYLLYKGSDPGSVIQRASFLQSILSRTTVKRFKRIKDIEKVEKRRVKKFSLLMEAVKRNNIQLVTLLLVEGDTLMSPRTLAGLIDPLDRSLRVHLQPRFLNAAFSVALSMNHIEMANLLYSSGAIASIYSHKRLLTRAAFHRLCFGNREKYEGRIELSVKCLDDITFDRYAPSIIRSCAEVGAIPGLQACLTRNVNININEGIVLYGSLYTGQCEMTRYLLANGADPNLILTGHKLFCVGLLLIELMSGLLFMLLTVLWIVQIIYGIDVGGLTAVLIPTFVGVLLMYRIVPFHRVFKALYHVQIAQGERYSNARIV